MLRKSADCAPTGSTTETVPIKADTVGAVVCDLPVNNKYVEVRTADISAFAAWLQVGEGQHEDQRESPARLTRTVRRRSAGAFEPVVDDADEAAFEAPQSARTAVAVGDPALIVGLAGALMDGLGQGDAVDRSVEAAVAVTGWPTRN